MDNTDLKKQIEDLKMLIDVEEDNYKSALLLKTSFDTLKQMRENIRNLKSELQILLDKESVQKTGELPKDDSDK